VITNTHEEEHEANIAFRKKKIYGRHGEWAIYFGVMTTLAVTVTIDTRNV
jgi:hypothetical protein